ncbi:MAG: hypothetical protein CM1200mP28_04570 [Deltaproteobacteria bacterium]|nr:MAG: hypothetical protein CM1200mP28_04570 [Deltaproteobacteria bacterium]
MSELHFQNFVRDAQHLKNLRVIYIHWRSGAIRVERNWNGILDSPEIVLYSNSACFLPYDRIFLESSHSRTSWKVAPGMLILSGHVAATLELA